MNFLTIEEQLLFSTLRIESLDSLNQTVSIGTGFLINKIIHDNFYKTYLVSNKHVLFTTDAFKLLLLNIKKIFQDQM